MVYVRERVYVRKKERKRAARRRTRGQVEELTIDSTLVRRQATDKKEDVVPRHSENRTIESLYVEVAAVQEDGSYGTEIEIGKRKEKE